MSTGLDEQTDGLMLIECYRIIQGCMSVAVPLMHWCSVAEQVAHELHMAFAGSHVECCAAIVVTLVEQGALQTHKSLYNKLSSCVAFCLYHQLCGCSSASWVIMKDMAKLIWNIPVTKHNKTRDLCAHSYGDGDGDNDGHTHSCISISARNSNTVSFETTHQLTASMSCWRASKLPSLAEEHRREGYTLSFSITTSCNSS